MNDTILGYLLLAYLVAFVGLSMGWRSYLVWRQTGINPYRLGSSDSPHDFVGLCFRLVLGGFAIVVVAFTFWPTAYAMIEILGLPRHSWMEVIGGLLLFVSLVWVLIAQAHMGAAWRIGIDRETPTELVRTGVFRYSRNPIFLGMRVSTLGLFLVLPNAATLLFLVLSDVLIQVQVRMEEEHLRSLHAEAYEAYCKQTRRWL